MRNEDPADVLNPRVPVVAHCSVCGASQLRPRFSIPLLDGPAQHYKSTQQKPIYECESCGHLFAENYNSSGFEDYYQSLSADCHYTLHDKDRFRYQQVLEVLASRTVGRLLDIGCGTGTFLAMLPSSVERFGIEPTTDAADRARARGIRILQPGDIDSPEFRGTFDAVTAIDVLEHATDIQEFRRQIACALRPGGIAILLTGDCESKPAKIMGRYWYYMQGAEHIAFFGSRSIRAWLQPDFQEIEIVATSHSAPTGNLPLVVRSWLFFPIKWLLRKLAPGFRKRPVALYLPGDHMLVSANRKAGIT